MVLFCPAPCGARARRGREHASAAAAQAPAAAGFDPEDFICAGHPDAAAATGGGECEPLGDFVQRVIYSGAEEEAAGGGGGGRAVVEDEPLERLFRDTAAASSPPV